MKTLKEKIEVMQAAEDGEIIQSCNPNGPWGDRNDKIGWNWEMCDYRIKKEPRVFYVLEDENGKFSKAYEENTAGLIGPLNKDEPITGKIIKLQEVL